eukprot:5971384-Pleurochrysis_carterae.AAC.1
MVYCMEFSRMRTWLPFGSTRHSLSFGSTRHKPFNKKGKKAVAASAATRKHGPTGGAGGGAPGGRPPYELPNGQ